MNKTKYLFSVVIALVIINFLLIFTGDWNAFTNQLFGETQEHFVIKKLNFDDDQTHAYIQLVEEYKQQLYKIEEKISQHRVLLYSSVVNTESLIETSEYLKKINDLKTESELAFFQHLKSIKLICKPAQLDQFISLINEIVEFT